MPATATDLIRPLVRYASMNGGSGGLREAANKLVSTMLASGGKTLTSSTLNGKSFNFSIPAGLDTASLLAAVDEAANIFDEKTADGTLAAYLSARRATRTKAYFA